MDMNILSAIIFYLICPECKINTVDLYEKKWKKKGAASCFALTCICGYVSEFISSSKKDVAVDLKSIKGWCIV